MADKEELVSHFSNVTGVDSDRANFYLEAAAWDLEMAITNFLEEAEGGFQQDVEDEVDSPTDPSSTNFGAAELKEVLPGTEQASAKGENRDRMGTIGALHKDDEEGHSDEEGPAFYAGGSQSSGQQILGPPTGKSANSIVSRLFQAAIEHGGEEVQSSGQPGGRPRRLAFHGAGFRLGDTQGPPETAPGTSTESAAPKVEVRLKMWRNGFTVDSGDLRLYSDQSNNEFLESITMGTVPDELLHLGWEVRLSMEDHQTKQFVKTKASVSAFSGAGHMLGSPAPTLSRSVPYQARSLPLHEPPKPLIDAAKPVTTIQIRLANGQRMVAKFNTSHTVRDIRNFIAMCPEYVSTPFILMTTFPSKDLEDETLTLEEAELCNAVIVQRLTPDG